MSLETGVVIRHTEDHKLLVNPIKEGKHVFLGGEDYRGIGIGSLVSYEVTKTLKKASEGVLDEVLNKTYIDDRITKFQKNVSNSDDELVEPQCKHYLMGCSSFLIYSYKAGKPSSQILQLVSLGLNKLNHLHEKVPNEQIDSLREDWRYIAKSFFKLKELIDLNRSDLGEEYIFGN